VINQRVQIKQKTPKSLNFMCEEKVKGEIFTQKLQQVSCKLIFSKTGQTCFAPSLAFH